MIENAAGSVIAKVDMDRASVKLLFQDGTMSKDLEVEIDRTQCPLFENLSCC